MQVKRLEMSFKDTNIRYESADVSGLENLNEEDEESISYCPRCKKLGY